MPAPGLQLLLLLLLLLALLLLLWLFVGARSVRQSAAALRRKLCPARTGGTGTTHDEPAASWLCVATACRRACMAFAAAVAETLSTV